MSPFTHAFHQPSRPADDLDVLRDPRNPGRLQCVYAANRDRWRARVLKTNNLDTFPTQREAGLAVVRFYRENFGPNWRDAFLRRKANAWRVRQAPGGFVADVFVEGRLNRVTLADTKRRPRAADRDVTLWPTRAAARNAIAAYVYRRFGLFAKYYLWRNPAPPRLSKGEQASREARDSQRTI